MNHRRCRFRLPVPLLAAVLLWSSWASAEPVPTQTMMWPHRLWEYFGVVGVAALLACLAAIWVAARLWQRPASRPFGLLVAVLLAGVGFALADWNANRVAEMRVDDKFEQEEKAKRDREAAERLNRENAEAEAKDPTARIRRFAEDNPDDAAKIVGEKTEAEKVEGMSKYERAAEGYNEAAIKELGITEKLKKKEQQEKKEKHPTLADVPDSPLAGGTPGGVGLANRSTAITKADEEKAKAAAAAAAASGAATNPAEGEPAYHRGGPKTRTKGKTDAQLSALAETADAKAVGGGRYYRRDATMEAGLWASLARLFARWLAVGLLVGLAVLYLRRFNETVEFLTPLPLGGPWLDALTPKRHSIILGRQSPLALGHYLRRLVAKGESFLYFGPEDPYPLPFLPRCLPGGLDGWFARHLFQPPAFSGSFAFLAHRWPWHARHLELGWLLARRIGERVLMRGPFVLIIALALTIPVPLFFNIYDPMKIYWYALGLGGLVIALFFIEAPWLDMVRVRKITFEWLTQPKSSAYVFDALWFGHACFTVAEAELGRTMLQDLSTYLKLRSQTCARAPRSVNIIWDFAEPPSERSLFELSALCRRTNCRFLLIAPDAGTFAGGEELFDECRTAPLPAPQPFRVTLLNELAQLRYALWQPHTKSPTPAAEPPAPPVLPNQS